MKVHLLVMLAGLLVVGCDTDSSTNPAVTQAAHPGEQIWIENCKVCHQVGLAGAPIIGQLDLWQKRLQRGKESMLQHALEGWGDMPARGGNPDLTNTQVEAAVDYMLSQLSANS